jgi:hypothetical protein
VSPGTVVNGMAVVEGTAATADLPLLGGASCDPLVRSPGRRTRTCGPILHVERLFVGYGIYAPKRQIDRAWTRLRWNMWIDGKQVGLDQFGWTDRWLYDYPPVGFENVVLREWAVTLLHPAGRHSIRYRIRWSDRAVTDTTWRFRVAAK